MPYKLCKRNESQPQIATSSASPLPVDPSCSRKDLEVGDAAGENDLVASIVPFPGWKMQESLPV